MPGIEVVCRFPVDVPARSRAVPRSQCYNVMTSLYKKTDKKPTCQVLQLKGSSKISARSLLQRSVLPSLPVTGPGRVQGRISSVTSNASIFEKTLRPLGNISPAEFERRTMEHNRVVHYFGVKTSFIMSRVTGRSRWGGTECPYMDSPSVCKHSVLWGLGTTAHVYPASNYSIGLSMPGHNGLFARQCPIDFSCFSHPDILGFYRRRFYLFTIVRLALQSWLNYSCVYIVINRSSDLCDRRQAAT